MKEVSNFKLSTLNTIRTHKDIYNEKVKRDIRMEKGKCVYKNLN